jgi:hypothetical protein
MIIEPFKFSAKVKAWPLLSMGIVLHFPDRRRPTADRRAGEESPSAVKFVKIV